ncbi:deoxynucleoside kinase [Williamsoniiplasma lucivorax]|uniref:Deoxyadenosine/deoxycytidine kinase n=1 Tax=Williamsoniiplasma lucivorax TaxID=209274 RepID=A0A2S5RDA0_9MOLU|nr:deoxynucleoside kinase [Williamsoniiplasma lucivorax]PPE05277.1 deoxyadenosine/deoxycytidine kinase [Williamsoniiplasma lucivorax]
MRIAIFGTVGAGKSTVSQAISDKYGYEIFPEPIAQNPYFDDYYRDMKAHVFKMQIYMLTARSQQLTAAKVLENVIFDRTILEDPIFVKVNHDLGTMNDVDFKTYNDFYEQVIIPSLANRTEFDLVVYLKVTTDKAIERINERGIKAEIDTPRSYWETLNKRYDDYFNLRSKHFKFLVVDANTDDLNSKMQLIFNKIDEVKAEK